MAIGAGAGPNLSRARLVLAQRAGYMPTGGPVDPRQAPQMWQSVSKNLARDARRAGYNNPLQFLRESATGGVQMPALQKPQAPQQPAHLPLAYAASHMAKLQSQNPSADFFRILQGVLSSRVTEMGR